MTTKYILLCAVFLGIAILVVSAQPSQYTIEEIPKEEYDKFVMDLNNKKRAMVKRMNISQGYELMWDPELVKQLNEILLNGKKYLTPKIELIIEKILLTNYLKHFFALDSDESYRTIIASAAGVPGSNCEPGYTNKDGLCSLMDTKPPGIDVTDATDVTSGSSSTCFLIGFLLFGVSFYSSY